MPYSPALLPLLALWWAALWTTAAAQPGTVLELTPTGTLSTADIDRIAASGVPAARFAVDGYLVRFESTNLNGTPTTVTAQLFVPRFEGEAVRPIYAFGPGSTGLGDACAPSREHQIGVYWGNYRGHTLARAGQGFIGVMPDYIGFGVPEQYQPYFSRVAEGRVMLDAIRATRNALGQLETNVRAAGAFVSGYSQGGHAAFAAADLEAEYAPDAELLGVLGYGPSTDLFALFREFTVVAPLVVFVYSRVYGVERFNPADILQDQWRANLNADVTSRCIGGVQSYYPMSAQAMFQPAFYEALMNGTTAEAFPSIHDIMRENSSGLTGHGLPALIQQGSDDPVVSVPSQTEFVRQLCANGSRVAFPNYIGVRHDTRVVGFVEALEWMEAVAQGETPPSDCDALP
jgi:pimeloyl-ACP methyl ester carboxylesterase